MNNNLDIKKILLIDPDVEIQNQFRESVTAMGVQLICHSSGEEALSELKAIQPNCIISEFVTDDMDGNQIFLRVIQDKEFSQIRPVPIVLLSEEKFRQQFGDNLFDSGLRGWYAKPLNNHAIREIVYNLYMMAGVLRRNKELKQEVRRSEYRYRDLLENATDFIFTLDQNGKFAFLNNRFSSLTSFSKEEWLEKPFHHLVHPGDRIRIGAHYEMIQQGRARVFESRIVHANNHLNYVSFSISPIIEKGTIQGAIGIGRDITEQKKM